MSVRLPIYFEETKEKQVFVRPILNNKFYSITQLFDQKWVKRGAYTLLGGAALFVICSLISLYVTSHFFSLSDLFTRLSQVLASTGMIGTIFVFGGSGAVYTLAIAVILSLFLYSRTKPSIPTLSEANAKKVANSLLPDDFFIYRSDQGALFQYYCGVTEDGQEKILKLPLFPRFNAEQLSRAEKQVTAAEALVYISTNSEEESESLNILFYNSEEKRVVRSPLSILSTDEALRRREDTFYFLSKDDGSICYRSTLHTIPKTQPMPLRLSLKFQEHIVDFKGHSFTQLNDGTGHYIDAKRTLRLLNAAEKRVTAEKTKACSILQELEAVQTRIGHLALKQVIAEGKDIDFFAHSQIIFEEQFGANSQQSVEGACSATQRINEIYVKAQAHLSSHLGPLQILQNTKFYQVILEGGVELDAKRLIFDHGLFPRYRFIESKGGGVVAYFSHPFKAELSSGVESTTLEMSFAIAYVEEKRGAFTPRLLYKLKGSSWQVAINDSSSSLDGRNLAYDDYSKKIYSAFFTSLDIAEGLDKLLKQSQEDAIPTISQEHLKHLKQTIIEDDNSVGFISSVIGKYPRYVTNRYFWEISMPTFTITKETAPQLDAMDSENASSPSWIPSKNGRYRFIRQPDSANGFEVFDTQAKLTSYLTPKRIPLCDKSADKIRESLIEKFTSLAKARNKAGE